MSFIIGFSFIILLAIFTILLWMIVRRLPKEFALANIAFLIFGDGILVALWYFGLLDVIEVEKHFRLGIAGAFATGSMGRSIYFLLMNYGRQSD
jgi:hypothetical protein|tara:strand:- start:267 stop:548 length:282 start_codon:yes stop_codon:yes gene_type:complete